MQEHEVPGLGGDELVAKVCTNPNCDRRNSGEAQHCGGCNRSLMDAKMILRNHRTGEEYVLGSR